MDTLIARSSTLGRSNLASALGRAHLRVAAVFLSQVGHGADAIEGDVFHPLLHLAHGAAADIAADVRFAAELLAQVHELVRAEVVVLGHAAPVRVDHRRAVRVRADAVHPVIFVSKTTARPTQHGNFDLAQRGDDVFADAARVGDRAVLADPDAVIDAAAQVLREMAVNVAVDRLFALVGMDDKAIRHWRIGGVLGFDAKENGSGGNERRKKESPFHGHISNQAGL